MQKEPGQAIARRSITRRDLLWMLTSGAALGAVPRASLGQGVSPRKVRPTERIPHSTVSFGAYFTDVARQAGLTRPVIYGGLHHKDYIVETIGCGVAFLDFDNDGWLDIFVPCGTRMEHPPEEASNRLYKNNRDGTFTDVTEQAGLLRTGWAGGVCVGDYDNDGFDDLFITYFGQNVLYKNNGDGTFTDVTERAGLLYDGKPRWGSGCSFLDYNRDGHLDLFVDCYLDLDLARATKPGKTADCTFKDVPVNCGPRGLPLSQNTLYRNRGDGTFEDVTAASGIGKATRTYGMSTLAVDLDGDGWTDLLVASDSTPTLLFHNRQNGRFAEEGLERGIAFSYDGEEQAGMGIAVGDFNLDGHLDLFKTHFSDDSSGLYLNDGTGSFTDVSRKAGIAAETRFVSWGVGFADFDNNGWPDIAVVTGSVYPEIEAKYPDYPLKSPRMIFRNLGDGRFEELIEEAGPGIAARHCSRGCAFGDFDNDGDVDMVVLNLNEPPSLLRNDLKGTGHWIKIYLIGVASNRSAIGAVVIAKYSGRRQAQAVLSQSSFYSANDRRLHFGLGPAAEVDLEVHWPSGYIEHVHSGAVDRLLTLQEGHGILRSEKVPFAPSKAVQSTSAAEDLPSALRRGDVAEKHGI